MLSLAMVGGRVMDDLGAPVDGALVGIVAARDASVGTANRLGRFTLGVISLDPVRVVARKPGHIFEVRTGVVPWTLNLELVLCREGSLSGRILADPLPRQFGLRLLTREKDGRRRAAQGGALWQWPDGCFHVSRLRPGVYEVAVQADGYSLEKGPVAEVHAGEDTVGLEVRLHRP